MHAIANPLLAERIIQLNNHPLRVDILLPVINSLPLRKKGLGSAVAGPFFFCSSETYVTVTASFPSRVGAGEFSEKKEKLSVTLKLLIMVFFPLTLSPFFFF